MLEKGGRTPVTALFRAFRFRLVLRITCVKRRAESWIFAEASVAAGTALKGRSYGGQRLIDVGDTKDLKVSSNQWVNSLSW